MKYVYVASKPSARGVDYDHAIMAQNKLCLYSIIEGMRQQGFNTHTLNDTLVTIKDYAENYARPCHGEIFVDSGGYSIIQGAVHPSAVPRFVQCYNAMLLCPTCYHNIYKGIYQKFIPLSEFISDIEHIKIAHKYALMIDAYYKNIITKITISNIGD